MLIVLSPGIKPQKDGSIDCDTPEQAQLILEKAIQQKRPVTLFAQGSLYYRYDPSRKATVAHFH